MGGGARSSVTGDRGALKYCVCSTLLRGPGRGVGNELIQAIRHGFCGRRLHLVLRGRLSFRPRLRSQSLCETYVSTLCIDGRTRGGGVSNESFICLFVSSVVFCRHPLGAGGSLVSGYPCRRGRCVSQRAKRMGRTPVGYVTGSRPLFRRFHL